MEGLAQCPGLVRVHRAAVQEVPLLCPRGPWLRSELCCLGPSSLSTTPSASPAGTLRFRSSLIRNAFAVRERLGDLRDLPYFRCCSFQACHRPYPGGPLLLLSRLLSQRFQASSI